MVNSWLRFQRFESESESQSSPKSPLTKPRNLTDSKDSSRSCNLGFLPITKKFPSLENFKLHFVGWNRWNTDWTYLQGQLKGYKTYSYSLLTGLPHIDIPWGYLSSWSELNRPYCNYALNKVGTCEKQSPNPSVWRNIHTTTTTNRGREQVAKFVFFSPNLPNEKRRRAH